MLNFNFSLTNDTIVIVLVTFLYVFLVTCYIFLLLAPPRGMTLGQWYHALKGLALVKYHTKFQLSSPNGMKVMLQEKLERKIAPKLEGKLEPGYERDMHICTYGRNITAKRYMPHS